MQDEVCSVVPCTVAWFADRREVIEVVVQIAGEQSHEDVPQNLIAHAPEQLRRCGLDSGGLLSRSSIRTEIRDGENSKGNSTEEGK